QFDELSPTNSDCPTVFVCHTIKGKGVPFMENQGRWHAGKITEEQFSSSVEYLDKMFKEAWGI
ncbi:MAG: transketolase, partial [Candidatus Coproplasma sp.]